MSGSSSQENAGKLIRPELELFRNSTKENDALQALHRIFTVLETQNGVLSSIGNDGARAISRAIIESPLNASTQKIFRVGQKVCWNCWLPANIAFNLPCFVLTLDSLHRLLLSCRLHTLLLWYRPFQSLFQVSGGIIFVSLHTCAVGLLS